MKTFVATLSILTCTISSAQPFVLDGPDAPLVSIGVNSNNFILYLDNPPSSNNYNESYQEFNPNISGFRPDSSFRFQGYLIYQVEPTLLSNALSDPNTIWEEMLNDPSIARLVAQSDLADTLTTFTNHVFDSTNLQCNSFIPFPSASNSGTQLIYTISTDAFTGQSFLPGSTYCFWTLAYAIQTANYDPGCNPNTRPLLYSRKSPNGAIIMHCVDLNGNGIEENSLASAKVYFSNGKIVIETGEINDETEFYLYASDGKLIARQKINSTLTTISELNISTGIYFYQLRNSNAFHSGKISFSR